MVVQTRNGKPIPTLAETSVVLIPEHLAEALRLLAVSSPKLLTAPWSDPGRRFSFGDTMWP